MEAYKNIYGVQKRPEQEVRSGLDMAVGASSSAATGAKIGNQILPGGIGAGVGGAAGLLFGLEQQRQGRIKEEIQKESDVAHNKFVDSLGGRVAQQQYYAPVQARNGMRASKYAIGEIEGDGSGNQNGLGEIHTDKNYNIKNIPNGGKTHEEGGVKVEMSEGDIVFPTQGNKQMYDKVMGLISRYKRGDSNAKVQLEKIRQSLPSDNEAKEYQEGTKGVGEETVIRFIYDKEKNEYVETEVPKSVAESGREEEWYNTKDKSTFDQGEVQQMEGGDDQPFSLEAEMEDSPTDYSPQKPEGLYGKPSTEDLIRQYDLDLDDQIDRERIGQEKTQEERLEELGFNPQTKTEVTLKSEMSDIKFLPPEKKEEIDDEEDLFFDDEEDLLDEDDEEIIDTDQKNPFDDEDYDYTEIEERGSPLRYANVLQNLGVGARPASRVTRRYYQPEELKYQDRSAADRRASMEKRNYQGAMMRGKGLSAGQQQGYLGQIGSRFLAEQEAINEQEARRADAIDQYNVQGRNQAKMQNIGLANQYDMFDEQADAAKQAYTDTAMSEISDLAEAETREAYMRDADRRAFFIDKKSIPLTGTGQYFYKNGKWWEDPTFAGSTKYTKKVNKTSAKQPKVNKFSIKQGQRQ